MLPNTTNQLPTLGYMHKVVCDCLGLWTSDDQGITFNVSATEKERRRALHQAFEAIKKGDGSYGSLNDLISHTSQLAPKDAQKVKKNRTIKKYVDCLANDDFESINEYMELRQYIQTLIAERYSHWGISELAEGFYISALAHYREFVREHACNSQQQHSFQCFISQHLRPLISSLACTLPAEDSWPAANQDERWPLRGFVDTACKITGISRHKLHQYHEFQLGKPIGEKAWSCDLTSLPVNTRSKQVVDRLRKPNRMKWETFYPTVQPLAYQLPEGIQEQTFTAQAFVAMVTHNLNGHASDCRPFEPQRQARNTHGQPAQHYRTPSSDFIDLRLNNLPIDEDVCAQQAQNYQSLLNSIRGLPGALSLAADIPNSLELVYQPENNRFTEGAWHLALDNYPSWLDEWDYARVAMSRGDSTKALAHFTNALNQAKYVAGPLFIPFYIQVCAFCKSQYRLLSRRNEEELFDRFYDGLGSAASKYAQLLGYTPYFQRDPKTLISHSVLPVRTRVLMNKTDTLARKLVRIFEANGEPS